MLNKNYINKLFTGALILSLSALSTVSADIAGFNVSGELGLRVQQREITNDKNKQYQAIKFQLDLYKDLFHGFSADVGLRTNVFEASEMYKAPYTGFQDSLGAGLSKAIGIYKASLKYNLRDELMLTLGLNSIPFVQYSEFLWDTDLTQPGAFLSYTHPGLLQTDISLVAGVITAHDLLNQVPSEDGSGKKLYLIQPSVSYDLTRDVDFHSYLGLLVSQHRTEKLNVTTYGLKIDFVDPIKHPYIELISLSYEAADNSGASSDGAASSISLTVGSNEINALGDFSLSLTMDEIEDNAFDTRYLSNERYFQGFAGCKGSRLSINAGITSMMFASFNYYDYEDLKTSNKGKNTTLELVARF